MKVDELLCFGTVAGEGNPALVVRDGPADLGARQALAAASRRPATVFLDQVQGNWRADYYYPHARSPLCLHATLAAAQVLFAQHGTATPICLVTAMQGQPLRLTRADGLLFIALTAQVLPAPVQAAGRAPGLSARLLGQPGLLPCRTPEVASVGSPKLLIEVADSATLNALAPPLQTIVDWGRAHGVNGCFVYCRVGEHVYEGRNFNHLDPALEDGATGVAAAALTVHLGHGLRLHQGRASGRSCLLHTRIDGATILVGGRAEPHDIVVS